MRLEESSADVSEHQFCDAIHNILYPFVKLIRLHTILYRNGKEFFKVSKRELIHRIYQSQVSDDKI
jgi:hypothetical protein